MTNFTSIKFKKKKTFQRSYILRIQRLERANSVDPDEVAHHEPPRLDLHYLQSQLLVIYLVLSVLTL